MPARPLFWWSRWQTYNWANYGPRYAPNQFGAIVVQNITPTSAQVGLVPGPGGQWKVAYGLKTDEYDQVSPWVLATPGVGSVVNLLGLVPSTEYFLNVLLDGYLPNPAGLPLSGCYYTDEQSFSTLGPPPPPGPVISNIVATPATPIASQTTVTWTTDVPSDSECSYQLNAPPTGSSPSKSDPTLVTSHSLVLTGMTPGATYQYTVTSKTAAGGTTTSPIQSFDFPG